MQAEAIVRTMLDESDLSTIQAAAKMGKSKGYFGQYLTRNSVPGLVVLTNIADTLGFDVIIRKRSDGTEFVIDPPTE